MQYKVVYIIKANMHYKIYYAIKKLMCTNLKCVLIVCARINLMNKIKISSLNKIHVNLSIWVFIFVSVCVYNFWILCTCVLMVSPGSHSEH